MIDMKDILPRLNIAELIVKNNQMTATELYQYISSGVIPDDKVLKVIETVTDYSYGKRVNTYYPELLHSRRMSVSLVTQEELNKESAE